MKNNLYQGQNNCLRKYRKARGLKQKDIANILGLKGTSMISRWEKGVCFPELLNTLKLALLYRTMPEALYIDLVREMREKLLSREEEILKSRDDLKERAKK